MTTARALDPHFVVAAWCGSPARHRDYGKPKRARVSQRNGVRIEGVSQTTRRKTMKEKPRTTLPPQFTAEPKVPPIDLERAWGPKVLRPPVRETR